jgi:predicted ATPase
MRPLIPQELIWRGWALGQLTPGGEALALMRQAIALWREIGVCLEQPQWLALLAETYLRAGQTAAARQAVEESLTIAGATGEDNYRPELFRIQGLCQLATGEMVAAAGSFQQALALARRQGTRSLELRAALNLSRLWAEQGQRAQAYELLAGVYSWFTEGFANRDLQTAKEFLLTLPPP